MLLYLEGRNNVKYSRKQFGWDELLQDLGAFVGGLVLLSLVF